MSSQATSSDICIRNHVGISAHSNTHTHTHTHHAHTHTTETQTSGGRF